MYNALKYFTLAAALFFIVAVGGITAVSVTHGDRVNYNIVGNITDKNGLVVELAEIEEQGPSSFYYGLYIYDDIKEERKYSETGEPVIYITRVRGGNPKLRYDGACYVVEANYQVEQKFAPVWKSASDDKELCFKLVKLDG